MIAIFAMYLVLVLVVLATYLQARALVSACTRAGTDSAICTRRIRPWWAQETLFLDDKLMVAGVALGIAVAAGLWIHGCALKSWQTGRPRGVAVALVPGPDADPVPDEALAVLARVRRNVAAMPLVGTSLLPGAGDSQAFPEAVAAAYGRGAGAAAAAAFAALRRRPYRVWITVHPQDEEQRKGLSIAVIDPRGRDRTETLIWDEDWHRVSRRAAHFVAAFVMPRMHQCRAAPWTPWYGHVLNPFLVDHVLEAKRFTGEGRHEEALESYDRAIHLDPLNPYLRLERAQTLDVLGLFLDALLGYLDARRLAQQPADSGPESADSDPESADSGPQSADSGPESADSDPESADSGPQSADSDPQSADSDPQSADSDPQSADSGPQSGGGGERTPLPDARKAADYAQYRAVCTLASSELLAEQWFRHAKAARDPDGTDEQPRRQETAMAALDSLRRYLRNDAIDMLKVHGVALAEVNIAALESEQEGLRRIFHFAALRESQELAARYRALSPRERRSAPMPAALVRSLTVWASLMSLRVDHEHLTIGEKREAVGRWLTTVCGDPGVTAPEQVCSFIDDGVSCARPDRDPVMHELTRYWCEDNVRRWPLNPQGLTAAITDSIGKDRSGWGWHEHYNAACVSAVGLLTAPIAAVINDAPGRGEAHRRHAELRDYAITRLTEALRGADSQFVAGHYSWLRRGDRDLNQLRSSQAYVDLMRRYLPGQPVQAVPANITYLTHSEHVHDLARGYCLIREGYWRARAQEVGAATALEPEVLVAEWEWWNRLGEYCRDWKDFRTRLELIRAGRGLRRAHGGALTGWPYLAGTMPSVGRLARTKKGELIGSDVGAEIDRAAKLEARSKDLFDRRRDQLTQLGRLLNWETTLPGREKFEAPLGLTSTPGRLAAQWSAVARALTIDPDVDEGTLPTWDGVWFSRVAPTPANPIPAQGKVVAPGPA
ncbi:MAG: hypothetical protein ACT4PP_02810 [Sporichthyaceae bacterium]